MLKLVIGARWPVNQPITNLVQLETSNHVPKKHINLDFPAGDLEAGEESHAITRSVMCDYSILHIYVDISLMHTICHVHNMCKRLCFLSSVC